MPHRALQIAARLGYGARGVIYLVIGFLAMLAALGLGSGSSGSKGALYALMEQPFGPPMVFALGCGMLCHAGWRFIQGVFDADGHGTEARGCAVRAGLLIGAASNLLLAGLAFSLALGFGSSGEKSGGVQWLMSQPYGRYLVGAAGLGVLAAGVAQVWKGVARRFEERMKVDEDTKDWLTPVCMAGLVARGIVFVVIAGLTLYAAWRVAPEQAGGLNAALEWIRSLPAGSVFYGVMALGLLAFGLYSLAQSVWRRVGPI